MINADLHLVDVLLVILLFLSRVLIIALGHHVFLKLAGSVLLDQFEDDVPDEGAEDDDEQQPKLHLILPEVGNVSFLTVPSLADVVIRAN